MNYNNIVEELIKENQQFIKRTGKDFFSDFQEFQSPQVTLICCSDSRVQAEALLNNSFNKIFTIRNIGNQIYSNEGSVDYGILHLKTPVLLILGHSDCGAIKAFTGGYAEEPVSIRTELDHLIPALKPHQKGVLKNIMDNIHYQVNIAIEKYSQLVDDNELLIIGALFDFGNELHKGYGKLSIVNINGEIQE